MADISTMTKDLSAAINGIDSIECGEEARKHFNFGKTYRNMNHGMLPTDCSWPISIRGQSAQLSHRSIVNPMQ